MWKGRQEGNIAKQAHCQRRKAQKQGCRVAGLQRARDVVLPGLEDLVIGKRISARRPGLGRPWDEEGRGLAGGSQGAWRGLAGQALCLDERPQTHMPKPYIALRRMGRISFKLWKKVRIGASQSLLMFYRSQSNTKPKT